MEIKSAQLKDAGLIHHLMMQAFQEYESEIPPSSALDETLETLFSAMENGEKSLICYINQLPVGMVRYTVNEKFLYFYRLSVIPEKRGEGIGKKIVSALESESIKESVNEIHCKVRKDVRKNVSLYRCLGYKIFENNIVYKSDGTSVEVVSMRKTVL